LLTVRTVVSSTSHATHAVSVELEWVTRGEGLPVLYLSGSGRTLTDRPSVFDSPLVEAFRVIAHDQRGLGQSSTPDGIWTTLDFARDAERLLDAVGIERCHVIGVSFGGMVAQHLASNWPDRVHRLVLAATSAGGGGGSSYPIHELERYEPRARFELELELDDDRRSSTWRQANPAEVARLWDGWLAAAHTRESETTPGERKQLDARSGHDCWEDLENIAAPTLVCAGSYDGVAPAQNTNALAAKIPSSRLVVFEGGHRLLRSDPTAWPHIIDFLREADTTDH